MVCNGKRYDDQFKADAMRLVRESDRSISSVAKDLGISVQTLRNWLGEEEKSKISDKARIMQLEAELRAEKRKAADLEETVAILKKATAIFVNHNRK